MSISSITPKIPTDSISMKKYIEYTVIFSGLSPGTFTVTGNNDYYELDMDKTVDLDVTGSSKTVYFRTIPSPAVPVLPAPAVDSTFSIAFSNITPVNYYTADLVLRNPLAVQTKPNGVTKFAVAPSTCGEPFNAAYDAGEDKYYFYMNAGNFSLPPTYSSTHDHMITSRCTSLSSAVSINSNLDVSSWDTSNVTNMQRTFYNNNVFNQDISNWDTSKVTNMKDLFYSCYAFDQDISGWDVSNVTNMQAMFQNADALTSNLNTWDTSKVTDMRYLFRYSNYSGDISNWNFDNVLYVNDMFYQSNYNHELNMTLPLVTTLYRMFYRNAAIDSNITIHAPRVTTCSEMFRECDNLGNSGVKTINIDTPNCTTNLRMFYDCPNLNINFIQNSTALLTCEQMFFNCPSHNGTVVMETSNVTNMNGMFRGCTTFNQDLAFDTSSLLTTVYMFYSCTNFNGNIGGWNTKKLQDVSQMFSISGVNQDLSAWDVSSVTNFSNMFQNAPSLTAINIGGWDTSSATNFSAFFDGTSFNDDISGWNVSNVTNFGPMFCNNTTFNKDLSNWDVSNATAMASMFHNTNPATDLERWNVSNISSRPYNFALATTNDPTWGSNGKVLLGGVGDDSSVQYTLVSDGSRPVVDITITIPEMSGAGTMTVSLSSTTYYPTPAPVAYTNGSNATVTLRAVNNAVSGSLTATTVSLALSSTATTITLDIYDPVATEIHANGITRLITENPTRVRPYIAYDSALDEYFLGTNHKQSHNLIGSNNNSSYNVLSRSGVSFYNNIIMTGVDGIDTLTTGFNSPLNYWDTSSFTDMEDMFKSFSSFNQDIGAWDVSNVKTMEEMFSGCANFNQDLSSWEVSSCKNMHRMFYNCPNFNSPLDGWGSTVSNVVTMEYMFSNSADFNQSLNSWDVSSCITTERMFNACTSFNSSLNGWGATTLNLRNTDSMFSGCTVFNQSLNSWDMSSVEDTYQMFNSCTSFNSTLAGWDLSSCKKTSTMFNYALAFTGIGLDTWTMGPVSNCYNMFSQSPFNTDIDGWDVSGFTVMDNLFNNATSFNQNLNSWNVSNVTSMNSLFQTATSFNGNISDWSPSSTTSMQYMFKSATSFNKPINRWDVSKVTNFRYMFQDNSSFSQDLNLWDTSSATLLTSIFDNSVFNGDITTWNVAKVTNATSAFEDAVNFNQDLSGWYVPLILTEAPNFKTGANAGWVANAAFQPLWGECPPGAPFSTGILAITSDVVRPKDPLLLNGAIVLVGVNLLQNVVLLDGVVTDVTITKGPTPPANLSLSLENPTTNTRELKVDTSPSGGTISMQDTYSFDIEVETTIGNVIQTITFIVDASPEYNGTNVLTIDLENIYNDADYTSPDPVIDDGFDLNGETIATITFDLQDSTMTPVVATGISIDTSTLELEILDSSDLPDGYGYRILNVVVTDTEGDAVTLVTPDPVIIFNYITRPTLGNLPVVISEFGYIREYSITDGTNNIDDTYMIDFDVSYFLTRITSNGWNFVDASLANFTKVNLNLGTSDLESVTATGDYTATTPTPTTDYTNEILHIENLTIGSYVAEFTLNFTNGSDTPSVTVYSTFNVTSNSSETQDVSTSEIDGVTIVINTTTLNDLSDATPEEYKDALETYIKQSDAFTTLSLDQMATTQAILDRITGPISRTRTEDSQNLSITLSSGASFSLYT